MHVISGCSSLYHANVQNFTCADFLGSKGLFMPCMYCICIWSSERFLYHFNMFSDTLSLAARDRRGHEKAFTFTQNGRFGWSTPLIHSSLTSRFRTSYCLWVTKRKRFLFLWSRLHLILSLRGDKEVVENVLQKFKSWPVVRPLPPAHHHDVIEFLGAAVRTRHPVRPVQTPDDLWVGHPWLEQNAAGVRFWWIFNNILQFIWLQSNSATFVLFFLTNIVKHNLCRRTYGGLLVM